MSNAEAISRSRSLVSAGVAAATAAAVLVPTPNVGAERSWETHCVIEVIGIEQTGELITAEPVCFGTLAQALSSVGADVDPDATLTLDDVTAQDLAPVAAASGPIGIHYDGSNRTGSSITVVGSDCAGGYLNLSSDWINRISSTLNLCPVVRFFDGYDKSGSSETTYTSTVNLFSLNNASNSVQYATA
jgi:hypothetical protein